MGTITKKRLIERVAKRCNLRAEEVYPVIQSFLHSAFDSLAEGHRLEFRGFGVFKIVRRKEKVGRNPKHPMRSIRIPERSEVKFTPSKRMKSLVEKVEEAP